MYSNITRGFIIFKNLWKNVKSTFINTADINPSSSYKLFLYHCTVLFIECNTMNTCSRGNLPDLRQPNVVNISSAAAYLQQLIFSFELFFLKLIYLTTQDISGLQFPLFCSKQTIYFSLMLNIEWND